MKIELIRVMQLGEDPQTFFENAKEKDIQSRFNKVSS